MISLVSRLLIISRIDRLKFKLIVSYVFGWDEDVEMMIICTITIQSEVNPCKAVNWHWGDFFIIIIILEFFKLQWQEFQYGLILNTPLFAFPDV